MRYGYKMGLDSFWHVERRYNNVKPLVSCYHKKEDDLRPAYRRDRKREHIVKLSPTCYALCDGGYGDPIFTRTYSGRSPIPTSKADTYNLSPIVWDIQVQPDGSYLETVKVRNGSGDQAHTSRYSFLYEFLPKGLVYVGGSNGKHYIKKLLGLETAEYYLPKSRSVDAAQWDYFASHPEPEYWAQKYQREDDRKYLVFARTAIVKHVPDPINFITDLVFSDWALVSPEFKAVNPKSRVDKKRKKELKPYLDEFWRWGCSVGKLLPITDWEYVRGVKHQLRAEGVLTGYWRETNQYNGDFVQHILTTSDHELRIPLLVMFMLTSDMNNATTPDDAKRVRAQFNRWANNACDLVTKTKGE